MGQKTNPNIFRLGINKTWKTEFFEKKSNELPVYTFKDLEIKSYIERFLESQNILVHDYKQHYSNSTLNLYISYIVSPDFIISKTEKGSTVTLVTKSENKKIVSDAQTFVTQEISTLNSVFRQTQSSSGLYKVRKYFKQHQGNSNLIEKKLEPTIKSKNVNLKVDGIFNNLFKVLSLFTKNKFDIILNFSCLNKTSSFLKRTQKKNFILLQKFKGTQFLKEGVELLFHIVHNRSSASLLAKFIAFQIKKIKRHKFFLSFLKQTLTILSNSKFSIVRGVKVIIKGRLNGVPRAKHKTITIGDVPVQSISARTDYSQITTHNSNGSYGIKVWIIEK